MLGQVVAYMKNGDFVTQSVHLTWEGNDLIVWPNPVCFNYNIGGLVLGLDVYYQDHTVNIKSASGQVIPYGIQMIIGFQEGKILTRKIPS